MARAAPRGEHAERSEAPGPPAGGQGTLRTLRGFGRAFWLVNTIEMLERGAYYGVISVLAIHLVNQGIPLTTVGVGIGVLQALLYFVPLFAAALAERSGYQKGLVAAFALGLAGYLGLAALDAFRGLGPWAMLPGILLLGLGSGTFKPIAAAAIARATDEEHRNLGFTIYYAGVNVGGFLGPLLIGLFVPTALYGVVFYGAALVLAVNLALSVAVYRNAAPPQREKSALQALRMLVELRRDPLYLALLLFYSGFWFVYAQQQFFLPKYALDYIPLAVNPALIAIINPATIILFGPVLGKLTQRMPSLPLIVAGVFVYIAGYVMVGLFLAPGVFILGVVLFSVGEVLVQPSFLSYSSKIAPRDRVAVYLGYSFLPVGIGLVLGATAGGYLYHDYAEVRHTPAAYWALSCLAGVASMAGVLFLNRRISRTRADPSGDLGPRAKRIVHSRAAPIAAVLLVPLLLLAAAVPGAQPYRPGAALELSSDARLVAVQLPELSGSTQEGQSTAQQVLVPDASARNLTFTLRWTDEPPPVPGATNRPDTFQLSVTAPNGTRYDSPPSDRGQLVLRVPTRAQAAEGAYNVTVTLLDAGDVVLGPVPLAPDNGNSWTLDAAYQAPRPA